MGYLARLTKFWLFLALLCAGLYFGLFNQDIITVHWPHMGSTQVQAAVAYLVAFLAGATSMTLFFGAAFFKKVLQTRRLTKRIRQLESPQATQPAGRGSQGTQEPKL